jgi:hypothetical protein
MTVHRQDAGENLADAPDLQEGQKVIVRRWMRR